ncbi:MAG: chemotaxis protein CheD [Kiritimatiellae bacterium]|nr:chemotaxis protein CheD [Kiritimatiellia bacterium]
MPEVNLKPMECGMAGQGILKIERIALGVGVILYSAAHKRAAGAHIVAPVSPTPNPNHPGQYANVAIPHILDGLRQQGVEPPFSVAVAGGATMMAMSAGANLGQKLVAAVKDELQKANLDVKMEDTGGQKIRSMVLDIDAGKIKIA